MRFSSPLSFPPPPRRPLRHRNASRQKLTSHCLAAILTRLPSPKLSLKLPLELPLPHKRTLTGGLFLLFQNCPHADRGETKANSFAGAHPTPHPPNPHPLFPRSPHENPPPATRRNPTPNPSPKNTKRSSHPFAKTTPNKNYPLASARAEGTCVAIERQ